MTASQGSGRPRLPRIRLRVRSLMLLVLALGCWLGWYLQRVRTQQNAVAAVVKAGGTLDYDWNWGHYNPDIVDYNGKARAPRWLAKWVPEDYVANVNYVSLIHRPQLGTEKANDETLRRVGRLKHLEFLSLYGTDVTDAGLAHVENLTELRDLDLRKTAVGDAGLAHLKGLTNLRLLSIAETRVTDEAVLALGESRPDLQILREEDFLAMRCYPRVARDLKFCQSQPVRLACLLLLHRARQMASNRNSAELTATIQAICDLEAGDIFGLLKLAETRAECVRILEQRSQPHLPEKERVALHERCADRGIAALSAAVDRGYNTLTPVEGVPRTMRLLGSLRTDREDAKPITILYLDGENGPGLAEVLRRARERRAAP